MEQEYVLYTSVRKLPAARLYKIRCLWKAPGDAGAEDLLDLDDERTFRRDDTAPRREGKTVDASVNHLITENSFMTITKRKLDAMIRDPRTN